MTNFHFDVAVLLLLSLPKPGQLQGDMQIQLMCVHLLHLVAVLVICKLHADAILQCAFCSLFNLEDSA